MGVALGYKSACREYSDSDSVETACREYSGVHLGAQALEPGSWVTRGRDSISLTPWNPHLQNVEEYQNKETA